MIVAKARHGLFLATLVALPGMLAGSAHAYVRAVTSLGVQVWWGSPCITMGLYLGAPPPSMKADAYWNASQLAARTWSQGDIACTGLSITMARQAESSADIGLDQKNVILFRTDVWCRPDSSTDPGACYAANALAITTVFKNKTTGEIVDADMEINAVNFAWADLAADPSQADGRTADFQNTLTHELGHVIGLAHNCYTANDGPSPLFDNTGNPEVLCGGADTPATVYDATMYPAVALTDTERRTLSSDEVQAACDIYPSSQGTCGMGSGDGCSVVGPAHASPHRSGAIAVLCTLALAFAGFAYRRSRPPA